MYKKTYKTTKMIDLFGWTCTKNKEIFICLVCRIQQGGRRGLSVRDSR